MTGIIKMEKVSHSFTKNSNELLVLEEINLNINRGEFLVLIGPSGCGKTTMLKLLAGFQLPESGRIFIRERPLREPDADRIMVLQDFNQLFPWKTVLQNVIFPLKVKGIGGSKQERLEIAGEYLSRVQLDDFSNYYPHQLSGGMKQRAALARALVTDPEVLLMDEPFGSLDSQTRDALQQLVLELWSRTGKTVIFVTHDIREAILLSDRIAVMSKGPGKIKKVITNHLYRPRDQYCSEFNKLYRELYDLL